MIAQPQRVTEDIVIAELRLMNRTRFPERLADLCSAGIVTIEN